MVAFNKRIKMKIDKCKKVAINQEEFNSIQQLKEQSLQIQISQDNSWWETLYK